MRQAELGDDVRVHYVGTLENGDIFDSSREREPMDVSIGAGGLIKEFEQALIGMAEGENKRVTILAENAYGQRHEKMVHTVAREQMPQGLEVAVGMMLQTQGPNGEALHFRVASFDDDRVVLDANHPLAGKTLTFDIELVGFIADA